MLLYFTEIVDILAFVTFYHADAHVFSTVNRKHIYNILYKIFKSLDKWADGRWVFLDIKVGHQLQL